MRRASSQLAVVDHHHDDQPDQADGDGQRLALHEVQRVEPGDRAALVRGRVDRDQPHGGDGEDADQEPQSTCERGSAGLRLSVAMGLRCRPAVELGVAVVAIRRSLGGVRLAVRRGPQQNRLSSGSE
jgi:hypothetical protein